MKPSINKIIEQIVRENLEEEVIEMLNSGYELEGKDKITRNPEYLTFTEGIISNFGYKGPDENQESLLFDQGQTYFGDNRKKGPGKGNYKTYISSEKVIKSWAKKFPVAFLKAIEQTEFFEKGYKF